MKVYIGSDHAGFQVKEKLKKTIESLGHEIVDVGPNSEDATDYPDFAEKVARAVADKKGERGVLICGTGIGMSMAANRVPGVLAACVHDRVTAEMSRRHNNANVFCAGSRIVPAGEIEDCLKVWMGASFEGGWHARRMEKISKIK